MRLLQREQADRSLSSLGFDEAQEAATLAAVERPQGLVLVTGPTGSGKTSTLYALLAGLATTERKLITVEDPIEYELDGIQQTQVNERAGYTFSRALRAILRQDPDVVMVGEIRDPETAELALEASLTGHLVLSTLHTNDAPSTVVRLRELGVPTYLLTSALSLVVAQRLVRRTCAACADHFPISRRIRSRLHIPAGIDTSLSGRGCARCDHTGYQGRVGIYEILSVDSGVRELIADEAPAAAIQRAARAGSFRSLREDALSKAATGVTTLDEVVRVTPKDETQESSCPVCRQGVEPEYAVCPWCAADLRPYSCKACDHALDPKWAACPRCGTATGDEEPAGGALPTVLVVDDDPSVRSAIAVMLTGDYDVVEAADGVEALERIHRLRPAAVVLDKGLPDIDGYEVTREIRSRSTVRDTPVVIVTGHDDPDVELAGLRAGADDWIAKPFEPDLLVARLDRLVRRTVAA